MSDSKSRYSSNSDKFINLDVQNSILAKHQYEVSKSKEKKYNDDWRKQTVNLNEIVEKFAPKSPGYVDGYKFIYDGPKYQVVTDMVSGYLRIKDKKTNQYIKLNKKPGAKNETHYKIKKRGKM